MIEDEGTPGGERTIASTSIAKRPTRTSAGTTGRTGDKLRFCLQYLTDGVAECENETGTRALKRGRRASGARSSAASATGVTNFSGIRNPSNTRMLIPNNRLSTTNEGNQLREIMLIVISRGEKRDLSINDRLLMEERTRANSHGSCDRLERFTKALKSILILMTNSQSTV